MLMYSGCGIAISIGQGLICNLLVSQRFPKNLRLPAVLALNAFFAEVLMRIFAESIREDPRKAHVQRNIRMIQRGWRAAVLRVRVASLEKRIKEEKRYRTGKPAFSRCGCWWHSRCCGRGRWWGRGRSGARRAHPGILNLWRLVSGRHPWRARRSQGRRGGAGQRLRHDARSDLTENCQQIFR